MTHLFLHLRTWPARLAVVACCGLAPLAAPQAQLLSDNEARQAIWDLRQRYQALSEENARLHQSVQELRAELRALSSGQADLRTRGEQVTREMADLQRRLRGPGWDSAAPTLPPPPPLVLSSTPARLAEAGSSQPQQTGLPAGATAPGILPADHALFEHALAQLRERDYRTARQSFQDVIQRYPTSAWRIPAQFWLGHAEYALRRYQPAIDSFQTVIRLDAQHRRAPEALLGVASSQLRLRQYAAARATLKSIAEQYPQSEAAQVAQDRLRRVR